MTAGQPRGRSSIETLAGVERGGWWVFFDKRPVS